MKDCLISLQQLLGDSSIATTQVHIHTNSYRLRVAVEKMPVKEGGVASHPTIYRLFSI